jgi:hypothetical protein
LYVGTDDGNVWVSTDGGGNWTPVSQGLPQHKWVSSIKASSHEEGTVFVSLNGYREDEFATYLFVSKDYGKTWSSVKGNLPESPANIVIQDPVNPELLYCGLDNGAYASLDRGATWHVFNGMLNVPAYDMVVHPRDNELVVGTHGRSVFVADVKPLQALKNGGAGKGIQAFAAESIRYSDRWGEKQFPWADVNKPSADLLYHVGKPADEVQAEVYDEKNNLVRKLTAPGSVGFHTLTWDLKILDPASTVRKSKAKKDAGSAGEMKYAAKGKYKFKLINGTESSESVIEVK